MHFEFFVIHQNTFHMEQPRILLHSDRSYTFRFTKSFFSVEINSLELHWKKTIEQSEYFFKNKSQFSLNRSIF